MGSCTMYPVTLPPALQEICSNPGKHQGSQTSHHPTCIKRGMEVSVVSQRLYKQQIISSDPHLHHRRFKEQCGPLSLQDACSSREPAKTSCTMGLPYTLPDSFAYICGTPAMAASAIM